MKQKKIIFIVVLVVFLISGCASQPEKNLKETVNTQEDESVFEEQEAEGQVATDISVDTIRAEMIGLGKSYGNAPVTYGQYLSLLDETVHLCNPEKDNEWQAKFSEARSSSQELTRQEAMLLLFFAAETLGPEYNSNNNDWTLYNEKIGESCWDDLVMDYPLIVGWEQPAMTYHFESDTDGNTWDNHMIAAYFYSFGRRSSLFLFQYPMSEKILFDYDEESNSMRLMDNLTSDEAILSVLRLYESVARY